MTNVWSPSSSESGAASGPAGGWLSGTYPNPSLMTQVVCAADQSVTNSIVLVNDDELLAVLVNAGVYLIMAVIIYSSPLGGATPDFRFVWGEDNTQRGTYFWNGLSNTDVVVNGSAAFVQTATQVMGTAAVDRTQVLIGSYISAGGTFRLKWAQNVANINPTIRRAGSTLLYQRIV